MIDDIDHVRQVLGEGGAKDEERVPHNKEITTIPQREAGIRRKAFQPSPR